MENVEREASTCEASTYLECEASTCLMRIDDANCLSSILQSVANFDLCDSHSICFVRSSILHQLGGSDFGLVEIRSKISNTVCFKRLVEVKDECYDSRVFRGAEMYFPVPMNMPPQVIDRSPNHLYQLRHITNYQIATITEITLSRISYHSYPDADTEEMAIKEYFTIPRLIENTQWLLIPLPPLAPSMSYLSPETPIASEIQIMTYYVHSISTKSPPHIPSNGLTHDKSPPSIPTIPLTAINTTHILLQPTSASIPYYRAYSPPCQLFFIITEMDLSRKRYLRSLQQADGPFSTDMMYPLTATVRLPPPLPSDPTHPRASIIITPHVTTQLLHASAHYRIGHCPSSAVEETLTISSHFDAVLSVGVGPCVGCACETCVTSAISYALSAATMVQSLCQSDTLNVIAAYTGRLGVMCCYRPFR